MNDAAINRLLQRVGEKLKAELREDAPGRWSLEMRFKDGRSQRVHLYLGDANAHYRYLGDEQRFLFAASLVGPLRASLDPSQLLRANAQSTLAALSIFFGEAGQTDGDPLAETIYASAGLPLDVVTPESAAGMIDEVAGMADSLEQKLFGHDEQ
jgi:hypothetical protein